MAWGRIFYPYGPDEPSQKLISSIIDALLEGRVAQSSPGDQWRDFVHAEDVGSAIAELIDSKVAGSFNIGSGEAYKVADIVRTVGEVVGKEDLLRVGALPAREDESPVIAADLEKITTQTRWKPSISLKKGVEHMVEKARQARRNSQDHS